MASMAPLFLVNTSAISSALREALPLPPARVAACIAGCASVRVLHLGRVDAAQRTRTRGQAAAGGRADAAAGAAGLRGDDERVTTLTSPGSVVFG
jgi:hypothetical protein